MLRARTVATGALLGALLFAVAPVFTERVSIACSPGGNCPPFADTAFSLLTVAERGWPETVVWTWRPLLAGTVALAAGLAVAGGASAAWPRLRPRLVATVRRSRARDRVLAYAALGLPSYAMHWWNGWNGGVVNLSAAEQGLYAASSILHLLALPFAILAWGAGGALALGLHRLSWWSRAPSFSPFSLYGGDFRPEYLNVVGFVVTFAAAAAVVALAACGVARAWETWRARRSRPEVPRAEP